MKLWVALMAGTPLSETTTVTFGVEGDCAMAGRQVNNPLFVTIEAPEGAADRL